MMKQILIAKIKWISRDEGGRTTIPLEGTRYCTIIDIESDVERWSIDFICPNFESVDVIEFFSFARGAI